MTSTAQDLASAVKQTLHYQFANELLLIQAVTHASSCDANASEHQRLSDHNERMEFLGDTLLGAAISHMIYVRYPQANEGELSRIRSHLVSRKTLARAIEKTCILDYCIIGNNLQKPWPDSVKANIAEAILGSIFLDGGWDAVNSAVQLLLGDICNDGDLQHQLADAKNLLQMWALKHHKTLPQYVAVREGGTDHAPRFTCTVSIAEHSATASGSSKRRSESLAAKALLKQIKQPES